MPLGVVRRVEDWGYHGIFRNVGIVMDRIMRVSWYS